MRAFPVRNDADLARAIDLVDELWDAAPGTPEADLREVMAELIEHYEARALREILPPPDPREVVRARMRELDLSQRELSRRMGWPSFGRLSEILSGKRRMNADHARDLERALGLAPGTLVPDTRSLTLDERWVRLPSDLVSTAASRRWLGHADLESLAAAALRSFLTRAVPLRSEADMRCTSSRGGLGGGHIKEAA